MEETAIKSPTSSRAVHLWTAAALFALTCLVFIGTARFDFINLDDPQYVTANDRVQHGLSWENVRWAFTTMKVANYHPLTWLSHMLDVELFGDRPGGHHATNVLIHSANVAIAYLALLLLTGQPWKSAIVAALFGVHPLRMESVAWIAERKDVLCAMFFLIAIACYAQYAKSRRGGWYGAVVVAFGLGILAKPMIVTLPCVLLLLDAWPLNRTERWSRLVMEKTPLLAMSVASSIITYIAQQRGGATDTQHLYPLHLRIGNAAWAYARYLRKTVWPDDLAIFYPYYGVTRGTAFPWLTVAGSAAILIAITALAVWLWRRERAVLVGWLWFLGVMVPTIGLVQVGLQSMADRYSYLPHIGLFIGIVWGAGAFLRPRVGVAVATAAVIAFAAVTMFQLGHWRDSYSVYAHALRVTGPNVMANMGIAMALTLEPRGEDPLPYYLKALEIDPNHAEAHNNLGNLLRQRGQLKEALQHLGTAVKIRPKYPEARQNLANVLADLGRIDEAIRQFRQAVTLDPDLSQAHYNLGVTLAAAGRFAEAIASLEHALVLRPQLTDARFVYALTLAEAGDLAAAKGQFNQVVRERPNWTEAMARFAWLLATSPRDGTRDPETAVALAEHANKLTLHQQPVLLDTLAAAQASAGRFEQAVATAQRARDLAAARGQNDFARQIDTRLQLYQSGKPFVAATQPATMPS